MWMMGCGDAAGGLSTAPTSARKLRPLVPRPTSTEIPSSSSTTTTSSSPPCPPTNFRSIHGHDHFFSLRNHFSVGTEHGKRELAGTTQQASSRWNPTPEQLRTLEELYRRGTRTPTADQIQHITAQLRRFGKIEGKNVFYWFQNHKARERQKRRRRIEAEERDRDHLSDTSDHKKDHSPGAEAADQEMITTKNSNNVPCTSATADHQESSCLCSRATIPESRILSEWQVLHLLPPSPPPSLVATATTTVAAAAVDRDGEQGAVGMQTLELFPLHNDLSHHHGSAAASLPNAASFGAFEFYQFLPLKN